MMKYELVKYENMFGIFYQIVGTDKNEKVYYIPEDPANADYQAYLLWLEEQA